MSWSDTDYHTLSVNVLKMLFFKNHEEGNTVFLVIALYIDVHLQMPLWYMYTLL